MYGKLKRGSKKFAFDTKDWTYFDVVTNLHREKIDKLAVKLSGHPPGSGPYLQKYRRAFNEVEGDFSEKERRKYRAMAKEWTERQPPPKIQQRYALCNDSSRLLLTNFYTLV
jgi:hypothetical protein